mmetsp:Transcript_7481/g.20271  ORF Transcript_7481/g.20271 Transcript_7481/m.20271 type:complete len:259 (+) Transcript_7481:341-1117(+)
MTTVACHKACAHSCTAVVAEVEATAACTTDPTVLQAWCRAPAIDHHTALNVATLDVWTAHDNVDATAPHAPIATPERQVQDGGVLPRAEGLDPKASKDQRAFPTRSLHDHGTAQPQTEDMAILRHPNALVVEARTHEHKATGGPDAGAGGQEVDGAVDGGGVVWHHDLAGKVGKVPFRGEVAAARRQDTEKLGHGRPSEDKQEPVQMELAANALDVWLDHPNGRIHSPHWARGHGSPRCHCFRGPLLLEGARLLPLRQ